MIANEPTMIAKGLQTACVAHSGCEWRNAQEIKAVAEQASASCVSPT
jgi:hypothetical protein